MVLDYKYSGNGHVSTHTLEMGMWSTHRAGMRARSRERWVISPDVTIAVEKANLMLSPTLVELHCGNGYVVYTHRGNGHLNSKNRMMCKEMNKVTSIASSLVPTTYVASKDWK